MDKRKKKPIGAFSRKLLPMAGKKGSRTSQTLLYAVFVFALVTPIPIICTL